MNNLGFLPVPDLLPRHAYQLLARHARVGIWLPAQQGFLLARYKASPTAFLFVEHHWDMGEPFGTAKPLNVLEACPETLNLENAPALLDYLWNIEQRHALHPFLPSAADRKASALAWRQRLQRREKRLPVHRPGLNPDQA